MLPIKLLRLKADVVHAPSFFAPLLCPCPVVLTVHDTLYLTQAQYYLDKLFLLYARLFIRPAARRAAIVCTDSFASRGQIVSAFGIPDEKVRVIYLGIHPRFRPVQDTSEVATIRQKYGIESPFFLFVGALEARKNVCCLLQAFHLLTGFEGQSRYQLLLVGPEGNAIADIHATTRQLGIRESVKLLGFVPEEDLPTLYSAAEAFVLPSLGEGFGLPLVEAMACGTPVITSRVSCMPEVAGEAALLVNPEDPKEIASAMRQIVCDEGLRQELVRRGLERAKLFTWNRSAEETEKLYELAYSKGIVGVRS